MCIAAGADGIKRGLTPPAPINTNIYEMSCEERKKAGISCLPSNLEHAIELMEKDEWVKKVLGDHVFTKYIEAKKEEWDDYRVQISEWEIAHYLGRY